jgi:hypothetical protein
MPHPTPLTGLACVCLSLSLSLSLCGGARTHRGSAIARIVGLNAGRDARFEPTVRMWVYEEVVNGRTLSSIINTTHENVKYVRRPRTPCP